MDSGGLLAEAAAEAEMNGQRFGEPPPASVLRLVPREQGAPLLDGEDE